MIEDVTRTAEAIKIYYNGRVDHRVLDSAIVLSADGERAALVLVGKRWRPDMKNILNNTLRDLREDVQEDQKRNKLEGTFSTEVVATIRESHGLMKVKGKGLAGELHNYCNRQNGQRVFRSDATDEAGWQADVAAVRTALTAPAVGAGAGAAVG
ncbi:MAG: hypothetical protein EBV03_08365 [Proteobacteria bacterium]|nr:hypothetical protein [Pseudomonadota bacterium]